jgi:site-specific DNA-methyltransferase (adenine-specific)
MMNVIYMKVEDLIPYKNNNKTHADNIDAIANSLETFGWQIPLVVDKDMVIISGHGRLEAAKKLKMKEVPVVISELEESQVKEFRIIDNVTQSLGKLDWEAVGKEIMNNRVNSPYLVEMKQIITDIRNIKPLDESVKQKRLGRAVRGKV